MQAPHKQDHSDEILRVYPSRTEPEGWWCRQYGKIEIPEGWEALPPGDHLYHKAKAGVEEAVDSFLARHKEGR